MTPIDAPYQLVQQEAVDCLHKVRPAAQRPRQAEIQRLLKRYFTRLTANQVERERQGDVVLERQVGEAELFEIDDSRFAAVREQQVVQAVVAVLRHSVNRSYMAQLLQTARNPSVNLWRPR